MSGRRRHGIAILTHLLAWIGQERVARSEFENLYNVKYVKS